jgi:hypothetical protein
MNRNRRDVRRDYLFSALEADAPAWACKIPAAPIKKLIPNQSVLALTARTWALRPLIPKTKRGSESGLMILSKLFILNNMAERVGFEFTRKRSFNNIERTAGTVKQWKTVVSSANGSQTDHGSVIT